MKVFKAQGNVPSGKCSGKLGNLSSYLNLELAILPLIRDVLIARKMKRSLVLSLHQLSSGFDFCGLL